MTTLKNAFAACLFLAAFSSAPSRLHANTGPGKPVTGGRRVLVVYNGDVGYDAQIITGSAGFNNLLGSAGVYAGTGFNFTVEDVSIPEATNAGSTWASATHGVSSYASLPLTAANYCLILDLRFNNKNYNNGSGSAGAAGTNYVRGDTIIQQDVTDYAAYLASGGGLFILGDNYYDTTVSRADGFISRMENMYRLINAVASTGVGANSNGFNNGPAGPSPATNYATNYYNLTSDFNNLAGVNYNTWYSGYVSTWGSGKPFSQMNGQPSQAIGLAWDGPSGDLSATYSAGRLVYWGDVSALNEGWAGTASDQPVARYLENAIDYLFNDTCCSAPTGSCGVAGQVPDPGDHPVISCFLSSANGWTGGTWTNTYDASGGGGGSLQYTNGGGGYWSNYDLFSRAITAGDLTLYDEVCFTLKNSTTSSMTFQIWNQSFSGDIASNFTVAAGATYSNCLTLTGSYGTATQFRIRNVTASGQTGTVYLDDVKLRHSCGAKPIVVDSACCAVSSPTSTPTSTATRTATRTATPTATPTASSSVTPSATPSATRTATPTLTATSTATPTLTGTPTLTASPTISYSATATLTRTPTATCTASPTPTSSITASSTRTATPSATASNTPGPSPTNSMTQTATPSVTPSSTVSFTRTATPSSTDTLTGTPTMTSTPSATVTPSITLTSQYSATVTPTQTSSFTPSQTATASPTRSATPSLTASPTQTLTVTPSVSFSASATLSATPTPTLTSTPSVSFSATPTGTATATQTLTKTPSPTQSLTLSFTVSPTVSPTPIPVPVHLTVSIYNAAGEKVKTLYDGGAQAVPSNVDLIDPVLVSGQAAQARLSLGTLLTDGSPSVFWDGSNDGGQPVSGGTYYFKVEFHDPFGATTSYVKGVQVLQAVGTDQLDVFNSAGELVWSSSLTGTAATSGLSLSSDTLVLETNSATGLPMQGVDLKLGGQTAATWFGQDSLGRSVASGTYLVEVLSQRAGSGTVVESKSLTVLDSGSQKPEMQAIAGPNPWRGDTPLQVVYKPYPGAVGVCELYNLAGERIAVAVDMAGVGTVTVPWRDIASGIYLLDLRLESGAAVLARQRSKIAVVK